MFNITIDFNIFNIKEDGYPNVNLDVDKVICTDLCISRAFDTSDYKYRTRFFNNINEAIKWNDKYVKPYNAIFINKREEEIKCVPFSNIIDITDLCNCDIPNEFKNVPVWVYIDYGSYDDSMNIIIEIVKDSDNYMLQKDVNFKISTITRKIFGGCDL